MKKYMKAIYMIGFATLISHTTIAREKIGGGNNGNSGSGISKPSNEARAANCAPSSKIEFLEENDVRALLETGGSMFQDRANGTPSYEVPKTDLGNGPKAIFAGSLWMGGTDESGQLKIAAITFRQNGNDFWPGPLHVPAIPYSDVNYDPSQPVTDLTVRAYGDGSITDLECQAWDKFFPMSKSIVIKYSVWWSTCEGPNAVASDCINIPAESMPTNTELAAINNWPAHGELGVQDYYLAPFYDNPEGPNGVDGAYNPSHGDTPWYDDILGRDDIECGIDRRISLFGDNTIWWVFNDKGNIHGESGGDPIGMEIRAQAFSFNTSDEINRMTFYNYEMINRSSQTLTDTYFSQWMDADLGGPADDYVGSDVSRGLGYTYNGDATDLTDGASIGYGDNPPAIGVDFFEGPYQDADGIDNPGPVFDTVTNTFTTVSVAQALAEKGIVYRGIGVGYGDGIVDNERYGMRRFTYFTNASAFPTTDPNTAIQFYNYMQSLWQDGSPIIFGGNGYNTGTTIRTDYVFPGDSDPLDWATAGVDPGNAEDWTEVQAGNPVGDRRFVQSAGPFILKPGAMNNITVGIVYGRSYQGGLLASVDAMKSADTKAQALFDACFRIIDPPSAPRLTIQELENELILMIDNPQTSNNYREEYRELDDINISPTFADRYYEFEGYQVYQLINDAASVSDLSDNTKVRLVDQCDIENEVGDLINFEFDEALGFSTPVKKVTAANQGIRHSFRVTEDLFAQGDRRLVNHKTYYFVVVAYGYNQYKEYNPNDPDKLDGQKIPYISSRLSFDGSSIKAISAVPHNPMPETDGTYQTVPFGSTPQITRLDGTGNGNRALELTQASKDYIVANGRMLNQDPTYDYGGGPINVKVVDPLNVQGGYYELKFRDYGVNANTNAADTARWTAYRYSSKGGALIDSITSERAIASDNEQLIPDWGVSVQIFQKKYTGAPAPNTFLTDPISASIEFSDSNNRWLTAIPDNDIYFPTNWIRSGTFDPVDPDDCNPDVPSWLNPCNYPDELGYDDDKQYPSLLGGGVAPHRLVGYEGGFMPLAYHPNATSQITIARRNAGLGYLPSVDIVITSDKSKWTRCPIIELGEEEVFNVGNAKRGELRKSSSVNKEGQNDGTGTTGMGWFPGYAIDLETGTRMYMAFGENSFISSDNGDDMIWNPTSRLVDNNGNPVLGGNQPIWVFAADMLKVNGFFNLVDFPAYDPNEGTNFLEAQYGILQNPASTPAQRNAAAKMIYGNLMWIVNPLTAPGQTLLSSNVTIKLRMNKEYHNYEATGLNDGKPMYSWNMDDIATKVRNPEALAEALEMINVVPNPYYAFSEYENSRLDTRVKITNLPERCSIKIYTTNGKLVRAFEKDSPVTSLDWDLNNHQRIPIASGVYLIHVKVPDVGERVLKFFAGMRQVDLQGI